MQGVDLFRVIYAQIARISPRSFWGSAGPLPLCLDLKRGPLSAVRHHRFGMADDVGWKAVPFERNRLLNHSGAALLSL